MQTFVHPSLGVLHAPILGPCERIQWFYDPMEHQCPPLSRWMEDAGSALLVGYQPRSLTIGNGEPMDTLQGSCEPNNNGEGTVQGGCCSTMCILFAVLVWRFAVVEPEAIGQVDGPSARTVDTREVPFCA